MQFSRLDRAAKPDIEAASDQQWESASRRATVLQNLLASGGGPAQVSEAARELGLSKANILTKCRLYLDTRDLRFLFRFSGRH
jgi:hypothetical protein